MSDRVNFLSPLGRLVSGSVSEANTTDYQGNPLVYKTGANIGQPKVNYYVGLAVPKTPNVDWTQEPWGQQIMQVAKTVTSAFDPNTGMLYAGKTFAFKVKDGDSIVPNEKMQRPCDQEGFAGNWILSFSNGFAPKVCRFNAQTAKMEIIDDSAIKRGYFVEISGSIVPNNNISNPGVFLNHDAVALVAIGEEIVSGIDINSVGFGQQQQVLPQGAVAIPQGFGQVNAKPQVQQQVTPQVQQQVTPQPATDLVQTSPPSAIVTPQVQVAPEDSYHHNGAIYTKSQLLAMPNWTEAHLLQLQKA